MRRVRWVVVLCLGLLLVSCGDETAGTHGSEPAGTVADRTQHLGGEGSPIADGLMVPAGTVLLGASFPEPDIYRDPAMADAAEQVGIDPSVEVADPWVAHLEVTGDPFVAYDELAAQIRALPSALAVPGTAASCVWTMADGGDQLDVAAMIAADAEPPEGSDGVECSGSAGERTAGRVHRYQLEMRVKAGHGTTLTIRSVWGPPGAAGSPKGWATTLRRQASDAGVEAPAGPEPLPSGRSAMLPAPAPMPEAETGEPFGAEVNCFAGKGYERLVLPDGATFLGSTWRGDEVVLATDDLDGAFASFERQVLDGVRREPSALDELQVEVLEVAEGTVQRWSYSVDAGGGACSAQSSVDGRYLLVGLHGD